MSDLCWRYTVLLRIDCLTCAVKIAAKLVLIYSLVCASQHLARHSGRGDLSNLVNVHPYTVSEALI